MAKPAGMKLDFDRWHELAIEDPEAFEQMRRTLLEEAIARAPQRLQQRLRGLQWRVDQIRARSATPLAACIALNDMMWEAFAGEDGLIDTLNGSANSAAAQRQRMAKLLPYTVRPAD